MSEGLQKCVWMWAGLLTYRLCDRDYRCAGCPVEALFHPSGDGTPERAQAVARTEVGYAADRFLDPQHLWVRILPGGRVQVGFDPLAARLLMAAEAIETAGRGTQLRRGQGAVRARIGGREVSFASPVTGEVLRTHPLPGRRIRSALRHPYTRGWLLVMEVPRLERQLSRLSFGRGTGFRLAREWTRFQEECVRKASGSGAGAPALPDGGELETDRLREWLGSEYPALVGRWVGSRRLRSDPLRSREEGLETSDGTSVPPEER